MNLFIYLINNEYMKTWKSFIISYNIDIGNIELMGSVVQDMKTWRLIHLDHIQMGMDWNHI